MESTSPCVYPSSNQQSMGSFLEEQHGVVEKLETQGAITEERCDHEEKCSQGQPSHLC